MDNKFMILVTQRNAAPYIRKCLDSVISQTYKNYEVIIMDDDSDDGTYEIIRDEYPQFQCIHTPKQKYHIKNFIVAINAFAGKEDIIVFVSGDDYLYGDDVFEYLNGVYQKDVLLTYGNFIRTSGLHGKGCRQITDTKGYRRSPYWFASHLVTCKKKLFEKIDDADLRYSNGEYPNNSFDCAMLYPMIEMCGQRYMRFIDKVLYVYNDQNPIARANYIKDPRACLREREYYKNKPSYPELTTI